MDVKEALPLVSSVASISIYHSSLDKHSIYQSLADQIVFEYHYQSESAMKDSCHSTVSPAMPTAHLQGYHSLCPLGWHGNVYPIGLPVKGILVRQSNDKAQMTSVGPMTARKITFHPIRMLGQGMHIKVTVWSASWLHSSFYRNFYRDIQYLFEHTLTVLSPCPNR